MSEFVEYTEPMWRGLNMRELKVDEAYVILKSFYDEVTYLYTLSDECYTCPYTKVKALHPTKQQQQAVTDTIEEEDITKIKFNVARALKFKLFDADIGRYAFDNVTSLCDFRREDMQEFGVYNLTLAANGTCDFATDKEGVDVNLSILSVFVLVTLVLALIKIASCAWRTYRFDEEAAEAAATAEIDAANTAGGQRKRMRSLDVFRGLAIVLMIFVNSGGGDYWWIEHAAWNGLHLADIVFPSFLWIMGVCIPISVKSHLGRGSNKFVICRRITWRAFKLFAIGLFLNSINGPQLENLRIMGVLQRFGIAFLICGLVHTIFSNTELIMPQAIWKRSVYDLILLKGELIVTLALIVTYLGIVFGLSVPGCPRGYLGPGGKHAYAAYPNCIGGATGFIDLQILGNSHMYQHPTAKYIYDSKAFDPEGVFGCLLSIVQVFFGIVAGNVILIHGEWRARAQRFVYWSLVLFVLGGALCTFTTEDGPIPINKNLWSLSFVFTTTSLAFFVLTILYLIVDVQEWWSGFPFAECGMNAITLYVGHTIMHKMLPWHWRIGAMNTHFILLLEAIWNTLLWIAIALYLDLKKLYYSL